MDDLLIETVIDVKSTYDAFKIMKRLKQADYKDIIVSRRAPHIIKYDSIRLINASTPMNYEGAYDPWWDVILIDMSVSAAHSYSKFRSVLSHENKHRVDFHRIKKAKGFTKATEKFLEPKYETMALRRQALFEKVVLKESVYFRID